MVRCICDVLPNKSSLSYRNFSADVNSSCPSLCKNMALNTWRNFLYRSGLPHEINLFPPEYFKTSFRWIRELAAGKQSDSPSMRAVATVRRGKRACETPGGAPEHLRRNAYGFRLTFDRQRVIIVPNGQFNSRGRHADKRAGNPAAYP